VPQELKGTFTVELKYDTSPFEIKLEKTAIELK
jgi:hypothetical protein